MALNISPRTLQYYRNKGIIPYSFIGNKIYYEATTIASILSQDIITSQSELFQNIMTKIDAASNLASELLNNQRKRLCQEHYLSSEEFCRRFHISRRTLQDYRDNLIIPYTSIGGKILYPESEIKKVLLKNYQSAGNTLAEGPYSVLLNTNHQKL